MEEVSNAHEGILLNPNRLWNMDETGIKVTEGKLERAFAGTSTKDEGKRGVPYTF